MEILNPITVLDAMLTTNVSITETAWTAGTYALGTQRYITHTLYEVIVASTSDSPTDGIIAVPPTWADIGSINRWKMFNEIVGDQTTNSSTIDVTVEVPTACNMVAAINIEATTVAVTVTDPVEGLVFSETRNTADIGVLDWWEYYFLTYESLTDMIFSNLPSYPLADIRVVLSLPTGTAKCGELVIGQSRFIGYTQYGTTVGIIDYSKKETDSLGRFIISQKAFSKRVDFDLDLDVNAVSAVQTYLAQNRSRPMVWVGDPIVPAVIVYGFFRNFSIVFSNAVSAACTIQVEGLT